MRCKKIITEPSPSNIWPIDWAEFVNPVLWTFVSVLSNIVVATYEYMLIILNSYLIDDISLVIYFLFPLCSKLEKLKYKSKHCNYITSKTADYFSDNRGAIWYPVYQNGIERTY